MIATVIPVNVTVYGVTVSTAETDMLSEISVCGKRGINLEIRMRIIVGNRKYNLTDSQTEHIISDYKITAFCISLQVDGGILLCHSATGELVLLNTEEYREICSGAPLKGAWAELLSEHLFLPGKDVDEYCRVDCERAETLDSQDNRQAVTSFTILPTTRCNARCFYCYEKDIPPQNMNLKTAEDTAVYIAQNCGNRKVHLSWFGGEPTVAGPVITRICERLQEQKVEYDSSMISNGFLLNESMVRLAKECWNLHRVQITVDGTESVYNSTKNYKGVWSNPFKVVLSNINCLLKQEIHVSIRINLGLHNYEDVSNIIQELMQRFRNCRYLSLYVHEIDNYYTMEEYAELINGATDFNLRLIDENMRQAFALPSIRMRSCMADSESSLLINPNGQLGKCEHYAYEKLCGSIYSPVRDLHMIKEWQQPVRFLQCRSCPFYASCLPLKWCNGGNFVCSDVIIKNKMRITIDTMRRLYEKWKKDRHNIRNNYYFLLTCHLKMAQTGDQMTADFFRDGSFRPVRSLSVNYTARDILLFLQEKHTFKDILGMLRQKYDAFGFCIEDDIEEYLVFLLHEGLCSVSARSVSEKCSNKKQKAGNTALQ